MDAVRLLTSLMGSNATGGNVLGSLMGAAGGRGGASSMAAVAGLLGGGGGSGMNSMLSGLMGGGGASGAAGLAGMLGGLAGGTGGGGAADMLSGLMGGGESQAEMSEDEAALVCVRAMCHAAKADGHVDEAEVEAIVARLNDAGEEEIAYVRQHLEGPVDIASFTNGVPAQMAPQVYAMSVMGMNLDTDAEAQHLAEVAQALGMAPDQCNQIHEQLGAPQIYK